MTTSCSTPFTVNFNNLSVNGGTFNWNFGDGGNSTLLNPSHTYTNYGTYTVELFADGGASCGSDTETKVAYIIVDSNTACTSLMPVSSTTTLTSCSGSLFDSGGPCAPYGADQTAIATISPPLAGQVHLSFPLFDVEAGDQGGTICNYDNLKIYDGPNTTYPLIGTYCNNNLPPATISSSSSSITILLQIQDWKNQDSKLTGLVMLQLLLQQLIFLSILIPLVQELFNSLICLLTDHRTGYGILVTETHQQLKAHHILILNLDYIPYN